jgi:hypothetical protein
MSTFFIHFLVAAQLFFCLCTARAETSFKFQSIRKVPVEVTIVDQTGKGVPFARLNISTAHMTVRRKKLIQQSQAHQVFFSGLSNQDGVIRGTALIQNHIKRVAFSVVKAGYKGRYSTRKLRKVWGPTAPALYVSKKLSRQKRKGKLTFNLKLRIRTFN